MQDPLKAFIVAICVSIVLWCLLGDDDGWGLLADDASDGGDGGGD